MIKVVGKGQYVLVSKKTGRHLSKPASLKATKDREREISFFKQKDKSK